ncbi:hypothetical protein HGRIS_012671 [Hohenbuehelia grisea]|uniref:NAD(P)-binding domain-containing protein n=1 Tax=Hohenbuehelia grisea TaxID=104357 RepID=A0ABR3IT43_9AGAR
MAQNVFAVGASKNIGYFTSLRLLAAGANITFLLRSTSAFDNDEKMQGYIKSGKAHLVKGDGLVREDVQKAWTAASKHGPIDLLLFTVGGVPSYSLLKGFVITPPNLVTQCLLNTLCTMPQQTDQPKIVALTSMGISHSAHSKVPLALKPIYGYALTEPHKDKLGAERLIAHVSGEPWDSKNWDEPKAEIMGGANWQQHEGLPQPGSLNRILVVRPAMFAGEGCEAEKPKGKRYRVSEGDISGYTITREDVAHFIADAVLNRWDEYEGKRVNVVF